MIPELKIAIVTPGLFAIPSSGCSSVERVVDEISRRNSGNIHYVLYSRKEAGYAHSEKSGSIVHVRPVAGTRHAYRYAVSRHLQQVRPHVIQIENRPGWVRFFRRRHPRIPIWISLHSITFLPTHAAAIRAMNGQLSGCDGIVVNSHFMKRYVQKHFPKLRCPVMVNHLGVDAGRFLSKWSEQGKEEARKLKAEMGYEDKKILLFVGRLREQKGVHHILAAMPEVIRCHPEVVLIIVGSAFYNRSKITPYVQKLHAVGNRIPAHVRFIPFVAHDQIAQWYTVADICLVPSSRDEAFGLVNVEAMSAGVPVIASDAGGIKEIILHGKTGYLLNADTIGLDLGGCINGLLADAGKQRRLGEQAIVHVREHFSWEASALRMLRLYRQNL